jgi:hypothetical protein
MYQGTQKYGGPALAPVPTTVKVGVGVSLKYTHLFAVCVFSVLSRLSLLLFPLSASLHIGCIGESVIGCIGESSLVA